MEKYKKPAVRSILLPKKPIIIDSKLLYFFSSSFPVSAVLIQASFLDLQPDEPVSLPPRMHEQVMPIARLFLAASRF